MCSLLGSGEPLRNALISTHGGGGQPRLCDLAYALADWWQATIRDFRILQGEVGHVELARRTERLRLGLTAQDEVAAAARGPGVFRRPKFGDVHVLHQAATSRTFRGHRADLGASQCFQGLPYHTLAVGGGPS